MIIACTMKYQIHIPTGIEVKRLKLGTISLSRSFFLGGGDKYFQEIYLRKDIYKNEGFLDLFSESNIMNYFYLSYCLFGYSILHEGITFQGRLLGENFLAGDSFWGYSSDLFKDFFLSYFLFSKFFM